MQDEKPSIGIGRYWKSIAKQFSVAALAPAIAAKVAAIHGRGGHKMLHKKSCLVS